MSGTRISGLTALTGAGSASGDSLVIFDTSADTTKRITRAELAIALGAESSTLNASTTYNTPSLAANTAGAIQTVTVTGAALGNFARASLSVDAAGVVFHAWVSAANTVSFFAVNLGGANPVDLGSATVSIRVEP